LFHGLPNPFDATRYHSLVVERATLPEVFEITAWTDDDEIMAMRHRQLPLWGVQFHPESILTIEGKKLLKNFLDLS
jgi:anthranilate synthase component 2